MQQTEALVVGASIAGLALGACLQKQGIEHIIIEKGSQLAMPWRNHYNRLHLHTNKRISHLPYKKFGKNIPRYPSRQKVIDYLEDYQRAFNIQPLFNTEAKEIKKEDGYWITETNRGVFKSKYLLMATGAFGKPKPVRFEGMETFTGRLLHSCDYKSGKAFRGQRVLVVGFGNSACEIAIDLYEEGALPFMAVRSPVNVIPRDVAGIPILEISQIMSRLPPRLADVLAAPLIRMVIGNVEKLGLHKMPYGPFVQIKENGSVPVLDIGVVKHIREGHIKICSGIDRINKSTVHFSDGRQAGFDAIVAAIGYTSNCTDILHVEQHRFDDLKNPVDKQSYFGADGLYFCGYWVGPTGQIREIAADAQKIAKDIERKASRFKS